MIVYGLDIHLELMSYPVKEWLFSQENYWEILDNVSVRKLLKKHQV